MAAFNELRRLIEPVMTVMETDESDEYLKPVWAPQILKFFNIFNQIQSMYQLIQYTSHLAWTTLVKYGCLLGHVTRDGGKGRYAGSFSEKK